MDSSNGSVGLGVLFTLGSLPIVGCAGGADDDQATSSPTIGSDASNTNGNTSGETTSGSDGSGSAGVEAAATDASADDTSASTNLTDATSASTEGGDTEGLPPACDGLPVPKICAAFGGIYADCYRMPSYYDYASAYCACVFGYYIPNYDAGPECATRYEDYFACIAALDCAALMDDEIDCDPQWQAVVTACGIGGTTGPD